jgi:hypothetical protein
MFLDRVAVTTLRWARTHSKRIGSKLIQNFSCYPPRVIISIL